MYNTLVSSEFRSFGGAILVASPMFRNTALKKSIIFVGIHSPRSTNGIILNQPQNKFLSHISKQFTEMPFCDIPIYSGGPKNKHHLTLTSWEVDTENITADISYMLGADEIVTLLEARNPPQIRGYLGYVEWNKGELEEQIKNNMLVLIDTKDLITSKEHGEDLWYELAKKYYSKATLLCGLNEDIISAEQNIQE